ncbi:MAG: hypothetical protein AAF539_05725, partial [Planctomycetota bacterium]
MKLAFAGEKLPDSHQVRLTADIATIRSAWKVRSMTSRQRNNASSSQPISVPPDVSQSRDRRRSRSANRRRRDATTHQRRRSILESLEARQLLAGPQLIGIQPNEGELITEGSVRDSSPRVLTFRFDEDQQIDPATLEGIRIIRAGDDGVFGFNDALGANDDIQIEPGFVTVGDPNQNEVEVRFAETLPDDDYQINVFGFDDPDNGITGLRNLDGELLQSRGSNPSAELINFRLDLGALIESVVPQPVVRNADGTLSQNRSEIVVYFNEDPLFVEDDADGNPTLRSAENPRFYQLLLTRETVRTTDDVLYQPEEVFYDPATHTARLFFARDINALTIADAVLDQDNQLQRDALVNAVEQATTAGELALAEDALQTFDDQFDGEFDVPTGGGTFRLRVGTAVDNRADLIIEPQVTPAAPSATISLTDASGQSATFRLVSEIFGERASGQQVRFVNSGTGGLIARLESDGSVTIDIGGTAATLGAVRDEIAATPEVAERVRLDVDADFQNQPVPTQIIGLPAIELMGLGDTLSTSLDVGTFTNVGNLQSLVINEAITPQDINIQLPGGDDDPGHRRLIEHINDAFGADSQSGITDVPYNFQSLYATNADGASLFNQIEPIHERRIREVLDLWGERIGVQFRETNNSGITFAVGQTDVLTDGQILLGGELAVRVDPAINVNETAEGADATIVFSNRTPFGLDFGEDFTRKATAAVGLVLGLQIAADLPDQAIMALSPAFLNDTIDTQETNGPLDRERVLSEIVFENIDDTLVPFFEPVFPSNVDVLHGQHVHRPDSIDIDLYRFEIDLEDDDRVGRLTVETFAERLSDASELDTSIRLFEETRAAVETDLRVGPTLSVRIEAIDVGVAGNGGQISFIESDRAAGDREIRIFQATDNTNQPIDNAIVIDVPRLGTVPVGDIVDAINADPLSSSLFVASILVGDADADVGGNRLFENPLTLAGGGLEPIARNDDYFSNDSFLDRELGAGVYYIGVAASGNDQYDPTSPGTGFGGTSQGDYELRIKFEPLVDETNVIRDQDLGTSRPGSPIDGDGDGRPGGVENFWFQTRPENRILRFDVSGDGLAPVNGELNPTITILSGTNESRTYEFVPSGTTARPGNIAVPYNPGSGTGGFSAPPNILASQLATAINSNTDGTGVSAIPDGALLTLVGERQISTSANLRGVTTFGRNLFVDKTAAVSADGTLARPFDNIGNDSGPNAIGASEFGDIIRVVGNGGTDGDLSTEIDNRSYQIGVTEVGGRTLEDGRNLEIPSGVTMMIDAGAIFKMRSSRISVGSSNLQDDRSDGALQILGTPRLVQLSTGDDPLSAAFSPTTTLIADQDEGTGLYDDGSVIITSTRDRVADLAAAGNANPAESGDWGGLVFRRDFDDAEGRRNLEDQGIFLQHVNHAEIRFGGTSDLLIGGVQQTVNPIQLVGLRPNITFNEITQSDDAAISASPNSFAETTFGSPLFQQAGVFTSDYSRIGPEIHNNLLVDNSINGVFVRSQLSPVLSPSELTVAGRFDDISVVHFIAQNLIIAGSPGGSITDGFRPDLSLVTAQTRPGGTLNPPNLLTDPDPTDNFTPELYEVQYRMTFVDRDGFESAATLGADAITVEVRPGDRIELDDLPTVAVAEGYVARRIYRADVISRIPDPNNPGEFIRRFGDFQFIADLDASTVTFNDSGSSSDGVLELATLRPSLSGVTALPAAGGTLQPPNVAFDPDPTDAFVPEAYEVQYRLTFVDADGVETPATSVLDALTVQIDLNDMVTLQNLPAASLSEGFVGRRLYRASVESRVESTEAPGTFIRTFGDFELVTQLDASSTEFVDDGSVIGGTLTINEIDEAVQLGRRGRLDGSLVVDPGAVVKLTGSRIELGPGTKIIAEGTEQLPVVFTSILDDRFGAGGTFDTNNDADTITGNAEPGRGNWAGLYASSNANVSLDHATIAYGGGVSSLAGGFAKGFAALEVHQANARVTNSRFEFNEDGQGGSSARGRNGRLSTDPSTIFIRGSQPIIVGNEFVDNHGSIIEIDIDSMTIDNVIDLGRQTDGLDRFVALDDNQGPLVRLNRYDNVPSRSIPNSFDSTDLANDRQITGMRIRGGNLVTEAVWDDTDIVHVLTDSVDVGNQQTRGGLLLKSRANESLVVKLGGTRGQFDTGAAEFGPGTPNSPTIGTGLTATGSNSDTAGRIGGSVHIVGLPGAPVVLTSLKDDTVGAGLAIDGTQFTDTNGDGFGSRPDSNDWRSVLLDQFSNDRNVAVVLEQELPTEPVPGRNGSVGTAQELGELASSLDTGDEQRRLGFEVSGFLSSVGDIDTYSFTGTPGTEVWIDIDRTTFALDTVIELLDVNGNLLARSDNSFAEIAGTGSIVIADPSVDGFVNTLQARSDTFTDLTVFDTYDDVDSTNPRDAGLRLVLPGNPNLPDSRNQYYFRVRSASINENDATAGSSRGRYEFQVRLREDQEFPGSVVQFADLRYANHGIHVRGLPGESPLLGEAGENENAIGLGFASNDILETVAIGNDDTAPLARPQLVGNLLDSKAGVISTSGTLDTSFDVDFYQLDIDALAESNLGLNQFFSTVFDIDYAAGLSRPDTNLSIFYDPDGERGSALPSLVLFGSDSNVADDLSGEEVDLIERLATGSISTGDPLIGPVSLPEGAYYIAVTDSSITPEQLQTVQVRREPINSVERLFEDRVEAPPTDLAGNPVFDTASGPSQPRLFNQLVTEPNNILLDGFAISAEQTGVPGHGSYSNFDGSNRTQNSVSENLYVDPGVIDFTTNFNYDTIIPIPEPGALPFDAIDLTALEWSLNDNPQIGSDAAVIPGPFGGFTDSVNTSTSIPHVSIQAGIGGDLADFYRIVVPQDNTRVIIDVDEGFNPFLGPEEPDEDLPIFQT